MDEEEKNIPINFRLLQNEQVLFQLILLFLMDPDLRAVFISAL